ncbi:hypothetical protein OC861_005128 [Tilletia horrida]|nr:hypothetical protein OC861_005128 [Tilletia horrida]
MSAQPAASPKAPTTSERPAQSSHRNGDDQSSSNNAGGVVATAAATQGQNGSARGASQREYAHTMKSPSDPPTPIIASASSPPASVVHSTVSTSFGPNTSGSILGTSGLSSQERAALPGFKLTEFNAISTVLNHPTRRPPPIDPNSSRYAPINLSHTDLPKVKKADFQAYLNEVTPEYNKYIRNQRIGANGKAAVSATPAPRASIDSSRFSISGGGGPSTTSGTETPKRRLPPLSSVPQIFFAEDFELGNPYTFDLVTERYKATATSSASSSAAAERARSSDKLVLGSVGGRSGSLSAAAGKSGASSPSVPSTFDVALNQMLQEKLSYYSDVVEQHLILEISARSSSFFAALGNLQDLSSQAEACLSKISELRSELQKVDEKHAKKGLRIVDAQSRAREVQRKEAALLALREVVERRDMARLLVEQAEYDDALEMIGQLRAVLDGRWSEALDGEKPAAAVDADLAAVSALKAVPKQLDELEDKIATALIQQLVSVLASDLLERIGGPEDVANETIAPPPAVPEKDPVVSKPLPRTRRGHARTGSLARKSLSESLGFGASSLNAAPKGDSDDSPRPSLDRGPLTPTTRTQAESSSASAAAALAETKGDAPAPGLVALPLVTSAESSRQLEPVDSDLRAQIAPLLVGLIRTGAVERATSSYREEALKAVRSVVHSHVLLANGELARLLDEDDPAKVAALQREWAGGSDAPEAGPGNGPIDQLRRMTHEEFLNVGHAFFEGLLLAITAVDAQCKLILQILDEYDQGALKGRMAEVRQQAHLSSPSSPIKQVAPSASSTVAEREPVMPAGVPASLPSFLSDIIHASAELSHTRASRLVGLRSATHAQLDLRSFLSLFQLCWSFVLRSELISRRMIVGLRGAVLGQAKAFLAAFHRQRIEKAAKHVEEELWAPVEVDDEDQERVKRMVQSAVDDPPEMIVSTADELILARRSSIAASAQASESAPTSTDGDDKSSKEPHGDSSNKTVNGAAETKTTYKTLDVEDRQYYVVAASIETLKLLSEYLRVVINLPLLTMEAMSRVVEFLKQFNSRTCQVVLGAGAMRSAGLKNITAKHLALASQSLSVMITLIPYIREAVRRHLSPKQAVMLTEFDKLRRDMQEHQYEIHSKLVAIMGDRLTVHSRSLHSITWNAPLNRPEAKPEGEKDGEKKDAEADSSSSPPVEANKYIKDLGQETATLNKVLVRYLHTQTVEQIMNQVLITIDQRIAAEFEKLSLETEGARVRLRADSDFLDKRLGGLKNLEWKGETIHKVVEEKCKAPPPRPPSPPQKAAPQPAYKPRVSPFALGRKNKLQQHLQQQEQQRQQQQQQEVTGQPQSQQQPQQQQQAAPASPKTAQEPEKQVAAPQAAAEEKAVPQGTSAPSSESGPPATTAGEVEKEAPQETTEPESAPPPPSKADAEEKTIEEDQAPPLPSKAVSLEAEQQDETVPAQTEEVKKDVAEAEPVASSEPETVSAAIGVEPTPAKGIEEEIAEPSTQEDGPAADLTSESPKADQGPESQPQETVSEEPRELASEKPSSAVEEAAVPAEGDGLAAADPDTSAVREEDEEDVLVAEPVDPTTVPGVEAEDLAENLQPAVSSEDKQVEESEVEGDGKAEAEEEKGAAAVPEVKQEAVEKDGTEEAEEKQEEEVHVQKQELEAPVTSDGDV